MPVSGSTPPGSLPRTDCLGARATRLAGVSFLVLLRSPNKFLSFHSCLEQGRSSSRHQRESYTAGISMHQSLAQYPLRLLPTASRLNYKRLRRAWQALCNLDCCGNLRASFSWKLHSIGFFLPKGCCRGIKPNSFAAVMKQIRKSKWSAFLKEMAIVYHTSSN